MIPIKEYAKAEGITLGAAYLRVWNGRVESEKRYGRIFVNPEPKDPNKQPRTHDGEQPAALETA